MTDIHARPYTSGDFEGCLGIFDSNIPKYFAADERSEFSGFLTELSDTASRYLVLIKAGRVVACGGLRLEPGRREARFEWGMVHRTHHGNGLGGQLAHARLQLAQEEPGIEEVGLATSQHTRGFYERFGFMAVTVTPDGFGPGLDRVDMIKPLTKSDSL